MTWLPGYETNIINYHVLITSSSFSTDEINSTSASATINLIYNTSYNITISQKACAIEDSSLFVLGKSSLGVDMTIQLYLFYFI